MLKQLEKTRTRSKIKLDTKDSNPKPKTSSLLLGFLGLGTLVAGIALANNQLVVKQLSPIELVPKTEDTDEITYEAEVSICNTTFIFEYNSETIYLYSADRKTKILTLYDWDELEGLEFDDTLQALSDILGHNIDISKVYDRLCALGKSLDPFEPDGTNTLVLDDPTYHTYDLDGKVTITGTISNRPFTIFSFSDSIEEAVYLQINDRLFEINTSKPHMEHFASILFLEGYTTHHDTSIAANILIQLEDSIYSANTSVIPLTSYQQLNSTTKEAKFEVAEQTFKVHINSLKFAIIISPDDKEICTLDLREDIDKQAIPKLTAYFDGLFDLARKPIAQVIVKNISRYLHKIVPQYKVQGLKYIRPQYIESSNCYQASIEQARYMFYIENNRLTIQKDILTGSIKELKPYDTKIPEEYNILKEELASLIRNSLYDSDAYLAPIIAKDWLEEVIALEKYKPH